MPTVQAITGATALPGRPKVRAGFFLMWIASGLLDHSLEAQDPSMIYSAHRASEIRRDMRTPVLALRVSEIPQRANFTEPANPIRLHSR
jgi:hypothetical protein